ncbi:MAG: hypothetical protein WDZ79_02530 [Candidatus Paceibacterota bacterium]
MSSASNENKPHAGQPTTEGAPSAAANADAPRPAETSPESSAALDTRANPDGVAQAEGSRGSVPTPEQAPKVVMEGLDEFRETARKHWPDENKKEYDKKQEATEEMVRELAGFLNRKNASLSERLRRRWQGLSTKARERLVGAALGATTAASVVAIALALQMGGQQEQEGSGESGTHRSSSGIAQVEPAELTPHALHGEGDLRGLVSDGSDRDDGGNDGGLEGRDLDTLIDAGAEVSEDDSPDSLPRADEAAGEAAPADAVSERRWVTAEDKERMRSRSGAPFASGGPRVQAHSGRFGPTSEERRDAPRSAPGAISDVAPSDTPEAASGPDELLRAEVPTFGESDPSTETSSAVAEGGAVPEDTPERGAEEASTPQIELIFIDGHGLVPHIFNPDGRPVPVAERVRGSGVWVRLSDPRAELVPSVNTAPGVHIEKIGTLYYRVNDETGEHVVGTYRRLADDGTLETLAIGSRVIVLENGEVLTHSGIPGAVYVQRRDYPRLAGGGILEPENPDQHIEMVDMRERNAGRDWRNFILVDSRTGRPIASRILDGRNTIVGSDIHGVDLPRQP